ncbi:MAG TPA: hypothetical protein V6D15_21350 [Oculatellaceae cyanobacterium]
MANWIKINYERNEYLVDLDRLSAFACAPNGRITFWLPDSGTPIIINQQSSPDGYYKVLKYIQNLSDSSLATSWFRIIYDRSEYIVNLNTVSSFCCSVGRLKFWLPDSSVPIVLSKNSDPDNYQKLLNYIERQTGHTLSC